jgi:hypothetical protein
MTGTPTAIDAEEILGGAGAAIDPGVVDEIALGDAQRRIQEGLPTDLALMYHPNGTTSTILLPPLGKNGRGAGDRRQKIMHYIADKKGPNGEQWWFASPPPGWEPQPLPVRCPVTGCDRAGGLPDLLNLWRHIQNKHPGEVPLYQGLLNQIRGKLEHDMSPDLAALLGDAPGPEVAESPEPEGGESAIVCGDCQMAAPQGHEDPAAWARGHRLGAHGGN